MRTASECGALGRGGVPLACTLWIVSCYFEMCTSHYSLVISKVFE